MEGNSQEPLLHTEQSHCLEPTQKTGIRPQHSAPPNTEDIAKRIARLSKPVLEKVHKREVRRQLKNIRTAHQQSLPIMRQIEADELRNALDLIKCRKAAGFDKIFPEFTKHTGSKTRKWLLANQAKTLHYQRATSQPPLLSVCYKIPVEQAGFMLGRNCSDQVLSLTTYIENGLKKKLKTAVAIIDLTCAYNPVWKEGLLLKLYQMVLCRIFNNLINQMQSDRLFQISLNGKT